MSWRSVSHFLHRWVWRSPWLYADLPEHDLRLKVATSDVVGRHLYKYRRYEPEIAAALATQVKFETDDVVFDIGANLGWYTLLIDRLAAEPCRIYAFEPDPDNFALLRENLALNEARSDITPVNAAAADEAGIMHLTRYPSGNNGRHSLLALHEGERVPVDTLRLDDYCEQQGLSDVPVRLLKIDIEGFEPVALRGAPGLLRRCEWILIEHSPDYMRKAALDPAELVHALVAAGLQPNVPHADGSLEPVTPDAVTARDGQFNLFWHRA